MPCTVDSLISHATPPLDSHQRAVAALRAMGIGTHARAVPTRMSSAQTPASDPGPRRMATGGSRMPAKTMRPNPAAAWKASGARAAWLEKKQAAPVATGVSEIVGPEIKRPTRGGKAHTTRE